MSLARADLESLLRAKKLDRTLTTSLPDAPSGSLSSDEFVVAPSSITALDARLRGGLPRGQLSEVIGPRSSGRTSVWLRMLAASTARGELVALVDALDALDVGSAAAAGVDLDRLLWIRGEVVANPGRGHDTNARALDRAIKALALVLQAGNFGLVVLDVADAPREAIRQLPFTTWLRLQRIIEGSQTTCVLVGSEPIARSAAGLTLQMGLRAQGSGLKDEGSGPRGSGKMPGARFCGRLFEGLDVEACIVRAKSVGEHVCVPVSTAAV